MTGASDPLVPVSRLAEVKGAFARLQSVAGPTAQLTLLLVSQVAVIGVFIYLGLALSAVIGDPSSSKLRLLQLLIRIDDQRFVIQVALLCALVALGFLVPLNRMSKVWRTVPLCVLSVMLALSIPGWSQFQQLSGFAEVRAERLVRRGNELYYCGAFSKYAPILLSEAFLSAPQRITTLVLRDNVGGSVDGASHAQDVLTSVGLRRVRADNYCASACASLWITSPERELVRDSALMFHAPSTSPFMPEAMREFLDVLGKTTEFARLISCPSDQTPTGGCVSREFAERLLSSKGSILTTVGARDLEEAGVRFDLVERSESPNPCEFP